MRILYFLTAHDVYSETFIRAEQAHFLGKGHEVYNLALKPKNTLEVFYRIFYFIAAFIKGTSLYRIELPTEEWSGNEENKRLKHWVTQLSLDYFVQKSKAIKPDRFVLHFLFRSSAVGHVLANKLACPYHLRLHTTKSNLNPEWSSAILEGANSISAISEHSRSHFKQKTHNEIKLIRQSLNWRKLESIKPKALQKRSGLLFVGRLVEKKGVKLLIDAYSLIPKEMRDEHALTIIGDGPLEPELRQKIHHLGLKSR